jgi:UDP-N-acetylmuramate--alanine ligase
VRIVNVVLSASGADAVLNGASLNDAVLDGRHLSAAPIPFVLRVTGLHNVRNAAAAIVTAVLLGVSPTDAAAGIGQFVGTGRRFELRGDVDGIRVIDDYAHHPTEIEALLRSARTVAGAGRVLVLFQPHLYSRTRAFAERFAQALALADDVVVTGIYAAREDPDPAVSARTITDLMASTASGGPIDAIEDRLTAARAIEARLDAAHATAAPARPGDVILTVGAGDVTDLAPVILADLQRRFG